MNALSLYVSTCRMVVLADAENVDSWSELSRLLPQLRQALSCSVCGKILRDPTSSTATLCHHSVCKTCIGGRMKIRPVCRCTKDYSKFADNRQMRILLQCFRKFCQYLWSTPLCRKLDTLNASTKLSEIIVEGIGLKEEFPATGVSINNFLTSTNNLLTGEGEPGKPLLSNGTSLYSVMYAGDDTTKITIKRKPLESPSSSDSNDPEITFKKMKPENTKASTPNNKLSNRRGCRCGMATQSPGKLTCCGQRCPCYVDGKECQKEYCKCRGCRNPCKESEQQNTSQTLLTSSEGLSADDKNHTDTSSDLDVF